MAVFAAHAGQRFKRLAGAGHLTAVLVDQQVAGFHQIDGLGVVKADGLDVFFEAVEPQVDNRLGCIGDGIEPRGGLVDADVGGLRGKQHRGKQLKGRRPVKLGGRVRVFGLQPGKNLKALVGIHGVASTSGEASSRARWASATSRSALGIWSMAVASASASPRRRALESCW